MRILALDSSGLVASVAVVEKDGEETSTIAEYTVNYKKTHSQTLLPMLDEIAHMTELDLNTSRCHCSSGRAGIIYRTSNWICDGEGFGTCTEKAIDPYPDSGRTCL